MAATFEPATVTVGVTLNEKDEKVVVLVADDAQVRISVPAARKLAGDMKATLESLGEGLNA